MKNSQTLRNLKDFWAANRFGIALALNSKLQEETQKSAGSLV
jgi:hypothetical protein